MRAYGALHWRLAGRVGVTRTRGGFPRIALLGVCALTYPAGSGACSAQESIHVLDAARIRSERPASEAVLTLKVSSKKQQVSCDVLVVGASTGGVAAALAVARDKHSVCLTEETSWIGGQMTAQGVSAFDGNRYIETTGATASFQQLRHWERSPSRFRWAPLFPSSSITFWPPRRISEQPILRTALIACTRSSGRSARHQEHWHPLPYNTA